MTAPQTDTQTKEDVLNKAADVQPPLSVALNKSSAMHKLCRSITDEYGKLLPLCGVAVFLVAAVAGVFGYTIGERQGRQRSVLVGTDSHSKKMTIDEARAIVLENDILKSEMATLIQERDIALNNLNLLKEDFQASKAELDEMKNLNQALTDSAKFSDEPLQVVDMDIKRVTDEMFDYRFKVLVPSIEIKSITPKLTLLNATSMVEIPLEPTHYEAKGLIEIKGRFVMPEGFVPSQVRLLVSVGDERVVKLYNWQVRP